ncbi:hypothetical protein BO70DRAFT_405610 [Aspergillus heteromorphus CBS 117.55]|uniref:F-box domain-containing protein n=1 Tax=Aspergillus heteromorphus CBS 117.55 TaxID=1448321 RepID=A0A317WB59_9EURO|nr:uncharacterized protein BO70DRAFT_405610 [Aspergillus heteromorphus CBS 117.55]PWY82258.1 hypothetical protein BO70DRAFT_405610 [Aspergillus heteromorphus CBS 117.55]
MPRNLHELPAELLHSIAGFLPQESLLSLRLVSRRINHCHRLRPFEAPSPAIDPSPDTPEYSRLELLPTELIWMIAEYLPKQALLHLRLTSRTLEQKTFEPTRPIFNHHLRTLHTNLSSYSLTSIHQLATNPSLRHIPQTLKMTPRYAPLSPKRRTGVHRLIKSPTSIPQIRTLKSDLKHSLTNCRNFDVGLDWQRQLHNHLDTDDVLDILYHIFTETSLPVEELTLFTQSYLTPCERPMTSYDRRRPAIHAQPHLARAWTNLRTINVWHPFIKPLTDHLMALLPQIITTAPRLERLIMNGDAMTLNLLELQRAILTATPRSTIRHLELRGCQVHVGFLRSWLLRNGAGLHSLVFDGCCILEDNLTWVSVVQCTRKFCPLLRSVRLIHVSISAGVEALRDECVGVENLGDGLEKLQARVEGAYGGMDSNW